jgi:hypothetical protein
MSEVMSSEYHYRNLCSIVTALHDVHAKRLPFNMEYYLDDHGCPSCAIAHWFARTDLQSSFTLSHLRGPNGEELNEMPMSLKIELNQSTGLNIDEQDELFSGSGCDNAMTAEEAAAYIEKAIQQWYPQFSQTDLKLAA